MAEIITFEQQGLFEPVGQGVGEAIAEVEAGAMTTLAVPRFRLTMLICAVLRNRSRSPWPSDPYRASTLRFVLEDGQNG